MDVRHALWIGGATGAGKSSIARTLAHRHDLQLYNVDHRTFTHAALTPDDPFLALTMDERWLRPSPAELAARFEEAARGRWPLILADLEAMPGELGAIVEGPQLLPSLIASVVGADDQFVLLVPDEERIHRTQESRGSMAGTSDPNAARANVLRRNLLLADSLAAEARASGFTVLDVDRDLLGMEEHVERALGAALARCPRGTNLAEIRQTENDALATQVRLFFDSRETSPSDPILQFACECGVSGCETLVELTLSSYDSLSAAGDRSPLRRPTP